MRVSLNDQDYIEASSPPFHTYFARPALTPLADACVAPSETTCPRAFSPSSGPTSGGTRIRLYGHDLAHGLPYTCRFGNAPYPLDPYPADNGGSGKAGHYARLAHMLAGCTEDPLNTLLPPAARGAPNSTCLAPPAVIVPTLFDPYVDRDSAPMSNSSDTLTKTIVSAVYLPVGMAGDLACVAPSAQVLTLPVDGASTVALEVSLNSQDYTANREAFTFYAPPRVISLSPSSGPLEGGTLVLLSGANLTAGSDYRCAFGTSTLPVRTEPYNGSDATLYCLTRVHTHAPLLIPVEISLNAQQYTKDGILFSVHAPVAIHAISPASGPSDGATVVTVVGGPFQNGTDYRCRFVPFARASSGVPFGAPTADYWREEAVNATVVGLPLNSSAFRCVSPTQPRSLRAHVEVTLNGQQYTHSAVPYEYTETVLVISHVSPSTGPAHGGTALVVHAAGIRLGAAYCCRLSVPLNDAAFTPFALDSTPGIVTPAEFAPAGSFTRFPWSRTPGTPSSPTASVVDTIRCTTPDVANPDMTNQTLTPESTTTSIAELGLPLRVTISTNCQQYAAPSAAVNFSYFGAPPKVPQPPGTPLAALPLFLSVSPNSGPITGSTNLTLVGGPFLNGSDVRCRFAPLLVMVPATASADGTQLRCQSPAVSRSSLDGVVASSAVATVAFANATTASAAIPYAAAGLLEVTLNGQQYDCGSIHQASCADLRLQGRALMYQVYSDPRVSALSPASGPTSGDTVLSVLGHGLSSGSHRICRFSLSTLAQPSVDLVGATSDATVRADGRALLCKTPPTASAITQAATVEVTLNGKQHTSDGARFDFFVAPNVSAVYPLHGPTAGGTQLLITGEGFHDFGKASSMPTAAHSPHIAPLLTVHIYPTHSPPSAPTKPRTVCTQQVSAYPAAKLDLRCRFGEDMSSIRQQLESIEAIQWQQAAGKRLTGAELAELATETGLRKKLAHGREVLAPTTIVSYHGVRCTSPPLALVGGSGTLTFDFTAQPNSSALMGSAEVSDGVLKLTKAAPYQVGTFVVHPHVHVELIREFDASFELLIAGGGNDAHDPAELSLWERGNEPITGMGAAFCYAPVDGEALAGLPYGEFGPEPARGLRVSLHTYTSRALEVAYDGNVLERIPLGSNMRTLSWTPVRVRYHDGGHAGGGGGSSEVGDGGGGGGLSVWYDGVELVSNLTIPGWAPTSAWRWSLSASTLKATDAHWVDQLVITSSNLSLWDAYPVALTLNRREYYPTLSHYPTNDAHFAYAPPPILSEVRPVGGPRAGGTVVTLYGVNLNNGTHYKCRWGGPRPTAVLGGRVLLGPVPGSLPLEQYMTPATYVGDVSVRGETSQYRQVLGAGAVSCVSPNVTAIGEGVVPLELSLNGQEYTHQGLTFTRYAPVLTGVYPTTGPLSGGFLIELAGTDLANGSDYRCRFEVPSNAAWAGGLGGWPAPPPPYESSSGSGEAGSGSGEGARRLSEGGSGSGEEGSGEGRADVPPPRTPSTITVPAQLVRNATTAGRAGTHDAIVCAVPAGVELFDDSGEIHVAVSLNAQQFTSRVELDTWWPPSAVRLDLYNAPTVHSISPSTGPAHGDTTIAVAGVNLTSGSNYTCRFGDSALVTHSRQAIALPGTIEASGASVRCVSPPFELKPCFTPSTACDPAPSRTDYLDIAPNGQDYASRASTVVPFVRFREPILQELSPSTGPSAGGTLVVLSGVNPTLSGGSDYRCKFLGVSSVPAPPSPPTAPPVSDDVNATNLTSRVDAANVTAGTYVEATVPASFDAAGGVVRCVTPPLASLVTTLLSNFSVSLNGQQYHGSSTALAASKPNDPQSADPGLTFAFFGAPKVSALSPSCGPTAGNTRISVSGSQLGGGSHYICRFGEDATHVDASTAAHYEDASNSVWCLTPSGFHDVPSLHLELTLNGQESTNDGAMVVRYKPPALYSISPASGPSAGATAVKVWGNHSFARRHGCDVRCHFGHAAGQHHLGSVRVPGTLPPEPTTGTVLCTTPLDVPSGQVEISLNGQQYTRAGASFAPYPPLELSAILPPLGIAAGNTTLLLPMVNLSTVGTDLRCRFGTSEEGDELDVPAFYYTPSSDVEKDRASDEDLWVEVIVKEDPERGEDLWLEADEEGPEPFPLNEQLASLMPPSLPPPLSPSARSGGVLTCTSPVHSIGIDQLRVTLNGQQFSTPLRYDVLTAPRVHSIYPLSTPELGGIVLTVHGEGFASAGVALTEVASEEGESSGEAASGGSGEVANGGANPVRDPELLRCRIGATSVIATLLNDTAVTCIIPTGGLAGVSASVTHDFARIPHGALLYGDAQIADGTLLLTQSAPEQRGTLLFPPPTRHGQAAASDGGPFPTAFRLSLDITMGTGFPYELPLTERTGGDGLAVSIGSLPSRPAGELGAGNGLRVCLRTRADALSVDYGSRSLLSTPLPNASWLRSNVSFPLTLALRNGNLSLSLNGQVVLDQAPLPEWQADARPSWRFGLSARTNEVRGENHFVHRVKLEVGTSLDVRDVSVEVSANGQQYSRDSTRLVYFGDAQPGHALPPLGPAHGGTSVIVRGVALQGGTAYRCRFGARIVPATFERSDESVRCQVPPLAEALGQDKLDGMNAGSGEAGSGGAVIGMAADGSGRGSVALTLALTLNAQDYEAAIPTTLTYAYYAQPRVLAVSPQAGPVHGETLVALVVDGLPLPEHALANGSVVECKFGQTEAVPATLGEMSFASAYFPEVGSGESSSDGWPAGASGRVVKCVTPASVSGQQPLYVSLNAQDYRSDGAGNFTFHEPPVVSAMLPTGGPRHGGTLVRVMGSGMAPSHVSRVPSLCKFGTSEVPATVDATGAELLCIAPPALAAGGEVAVALVGSSGELFGDGIGMLDAKMQDADDDDDSAEKHAREWEQGGELQCAAASCTLGGSARRVGGVLRLTDGSQRASGQLTITPHTSAPQLALKTWDASFDLSVLGAFGGLALSVGDIPADGVGAMGGGAVLRVSISAGMTDLSVTWEGVQLAVVPIPPPSSTLNGSEHAAGSPDGTGGVGGGPPERVAQVHVDGSGRVSIVGASWRALRVAYLENGLHITADGVALISALGVPRYLPRVGWRWVLSSSTGNRYGRQWVRSLVLRADASVRTSLLPVAVSLNGQQFSPAVGTFEYVAHPMVVSVEPRSGPVRGGTRVLVSGRVFADGGALHKCRFGGGGAAVNASRHADSGFIACAAPQLSNASAPTVRGDGGKLPLGVGVAVELWRHGQLQASDALDLGTFTYHAELSNASVATLSPTSGPMAGGTRLLLAAGDAARDAGALAGGSAYQCRFDLRPLRVPSRTVDLMLLSDAAVLASPIAYNASEVTRPALTLSATYEPGVGIRCLSPAVNLTYARLVSGEGAKLPISLSLNGQQFAEISQPLRLYEPPQLEFVSPACGPVGGGTALTIVGAQLSGGSDYRCRFSSQAGVAGGEAGHVELVRANYSTSPQGELLTCDVPLASVALDPPKQGQERWSAALHVSLNGQQYSDDLSAGRLPPGTTQGFVAAAGGFSVYTHPPADAHAQPAAAMSGQTVAIYGTGMHGGCAYACRMGDDVSEANFDPRRGALRCRAPVRPVGTTEAVWVSLNGQQFVPSGANVTWI